MVSYRGIRDLTALVTTAGTVSFGVWAGLSDNLDIITASAVGGAALSGLTYMVARQTIKREQVAVNDVLTEDERALLHDRGASYMFVPVVAGMTSFLGAEAYQFLF